MDPEHRAVSGHFEPTEGWSLELPGNFNVHIAEGKTMVIWRTGLTIFLTTWNPHAQQDEALLVSEMIRVRDEKGRLVREDRQRLLKRGAVLGAVRVRLARFPVEAESIHARQIT